MVHLRQVLNPLRATRPAMRAANDIPPLSDRQRGIFFAHRHALCRERTERWEAAPHLREKSRRFRPEPRSFWEETANSSKKAPLRANEFDGSQNRLTSLDVTANDE